ncbi:hypothetical protein CPB86DRAFT_778534 [Serendipita vermifera]|nr:hypothetical protein CPB86DRAFT_778534 [Serendipita vermifera]
MINETPSGCAVAVTEHAPRDVVGNMKQLTDRPSSVGREKRGTITFPVELLDLIVSYIPTDKLSTIALVHSSWAAIAIRYLYANVRLNGADFSILPREDEGSLPKSDAPIEVILQTCIISGCKMTKRLLANQAHIAAIREFSLDSTPSDFYMPYFATILRYIWDKATGLISMEHDYHCTPYEKAWPETLSRLRTRHFCEFSTHLMAHPLMRHITTTYCNAQTGYSLGGQYPHLTELDFNWHGARADKGKYSLTWIPEAFPNLVKLRFALCSIWDDETLPDMTAMRAHYQTLVANLSRLRMFFVTENDEYDPDAEEHLIHYLGRIQPSLDQITLLWRNPPKDTDSDDGPTSAHWLKSTYTPVSNEIAILASERRVNIDWYPDSASKHRYNWWLGRFAPSRRHEREKMQQFHGSDDTMKD